MSGSLLLALLAASSLAFGATATRSMSVTTSVRPKAVLTVLSTTQVRVAVAAFPNAVVTLSAGDQICQKLTASQRVPVAGVSIINFTQSQLKNGKRFCLTSSDGTINVSAPIR